MTKREDFIDNEVVKGMSPEYQELWNEVFDVRSKMGFILIESSINMINKKCFGDGEEITVAAYMLARVSECKNPFVSFDEALKIIDDHDIEAIARYCLSSGVWNKLVELLKEHDSRVFGIISNLRNLDDSCSAPQGIRDLACRLLDVKPNETFADICCGNGAVARDVLDEHAEGKGKITGYDFDERAIGLAKAGNAFFSGRITFETKDIFQLSIEAEDVTYDKAFVNYPFKSLKSLGRLRAYAEMLEARFPSVFKTASSDWVYNMAMMDLLKKSGKAVAIMANGATWNTTDAAARKYFVENGLIECVIMLPPKLFGSSNIPVSLIVFSHGNKSVKLIDASEEFKTGRRVNELTEQNVDEIMRILDGDNKRSTVVTIEELRNNDYSLFFDRYMLASNDSDGYVPFGTIIKRITRGAQLNASELDKLSSDQPTKLQYLMLANVHDGLVDAELPYVNKIEEKYRKYCLTDRCLILSKNGYPYKIAVAELKKGQTILANGNLYVVELDMEKVDPYYLAAFLSSEQGTALLKSITVGATMPNIGVDQLKRIGIPLPDMKTQVEIGKRYVAIRDEIALLQLKVEKAKARMAHIMEEGGVADA